MRLGSSQKISCTIYLQQLHKSKREKGSESRWWALIGRRSGPPGLPSVSLSKNKADMPFREHHLESCDIETPWVYDSWIKVLELNHTFQPNSDMLRMGLAHAFHICFLCSALFVRWHEKRHKKWLQLQRTTLYCRKCIAIFSWVCSDYSPFPNISMLPEGLLCLRGVLWQSRKLSFWKQVICLLWSL